MNTTLKIAAAALAVLITTLSFADARGSCDGYHGCRCGVTQANLAGVPVNYKGFNLKQASEWPKAFQHTSFQSGVVGYVPRRGYTGHVFKVTDASGGCGHATVQDERGVYKRNVCGATFMAVNSSSRYASTAAPQDRHHATYRGRHHRTQFAHGGHHHHRTHLASR